MCFISLKRFALLGAVTAVRHSYALFRAFARGLPQSLQPCTVTRCLVQSRAAYNSHSSHAKPLSATYLRASSTKATLSQTMIVAFRSLSAQVTESDLSRLRFQVAKLGLVFALPSFNCGTYTLICFVCFDLLSCFKHSLKMFCCVYMLVFYYAFYVFTII